MKQQCLAFLPQSYAQQDPDIVFFSVAPYEMWHRGIAYLRVLIKQTRNNIWLNW